MNHAISINPDKTLVITVPEGTEVDRVKIRKMGTQESKLYWRDEVLDQYKWERDIAIQQLKELGYGFGQEPKTDGDTISRQDAIDAALTFFVEFLGGAFHEDDQRKLIALYEQLPSAQPERKRGKWIKDIERFGDTAYHCDQCGAVLEKDNLEWRNNYYCYHCGAKMEDNKDE